MNQKPKKLLVKYILRPVIALLLFVIAFSFLLWWFIPPIYKFSEPEAFHGTQWFNPYSKIDTNHLRLSNFQIQSKSYGGITNGSNNSSNRVFSSYKNLGYDVITISDYMKINSYKEDSLPYISVYEHGYGAFKNHQVCLGSSNVTWLDFPLFYSINSKQFLINKLKKVNKCVAIAHPSLRDAYSKDDMKLLRGYDLIEALSNFKYSLELWDAALSAGNPVFLIANDDAHNLDKPNDYGRVATVIHSKSLVEDSLLNALKTGNAYGLVIQTPDGDTHEKKIIRFQNLPKLVELKILNDTVHMNFTDSINEVTAVGQNGLILLKTNVGNLTSKFAFALNNVSNFVRFEIKLKYGSKIYSNPIFRTEKGKIPILDLPVIDQLKTQLYRILGILVIFIGFYFFNKGFQQKIRLLLRKINLGSKTTTSE